jgi:hypothetical protein
MGMRLTHHLHAPRVICAGGRGETLPSLFLVKHRYSYSRAFYSACSRALRRRSARLREDAYNAVAFLTWAAADGYAAVSNCPYVPNPVPGAWEPTSSNRNPLEPCWGQLRPMVFASGAESAPPGPLAFSTGSRSEFYAATVEFYQTGLTLTAEQQTTAQYWADRAGATGTPPGNWIAIVGQLAQNDGLSLAAAEG